MEDKRGNRRIKTRKKQKQIKGTSERKGEMREREGKGKGM